MGWMAIPRVVLEGPPKNKLGRPKKTVPPLAVAVPVTPVPKEYENDVLLVTIMGNTPFRFTVVGVPPGFESGGTAEISTVVGSPGTKPVRGVELAVVAVTRPALSTSELRGMDVDGCVTSMPETMPKPPGVT